MRRPAAALALCLALAGGLSACGGDEASTDVVPKSTPDLIAPANASLGAATTSNDDAGTSTTSTTGTTPEASTAPAQGTTTQAPAAPAQTTQQEAPQGTGGAGATTTTPADAGTGTTGNSGGFSDFCQQNPGACPE